MIMQFVSSTLHRNLRILAALLLVLQAQQAQSFGKDSTNLSEVIERANQTLKGLFHYYWEHDASLNNVQFFFVCGQIGEGSDGCYCSSEKPCLECYRWWDAVALESIATFGMLTNTTSYANTADIFFAYAPYNAQWNATVQPTFIDDFAWYAIAYLRVYEWLKVMLHQVCYCQINSIVLMCSGDI